MKGADDQKSARTMRLRFGADRICLWRLCGKSPCVSRARLPRRCAGLRAASCAIGSSCSISRSGRERSFADIERPLSTPG